MPDICFASMERFTGCVAACRSAAAVFGATWAAIPSQGPLPPEVFDAGLLVLSSWHRRYEAILDARTGPVVPRCHGMVMETDLVGEGAKVARMVALLDAGRIPALAVSDPQYVAVLGRPHVVVFPDVLAPAEYDGVRPVPLMGVNMSLFGAPHARKNIFVQAAAFDRARHEVGVSRWTLHLNGQTMADEHYALWLETVRIPFVDHGYLERDRYLALVAAMDVGLCASLCESYCWVAVDHVALGVPVVVSAGVPSLGAWPDRVPTDEVGAIARALTTTLAGRDRILAGQQASLRAQAANYEAQARRGLADLRSLAGRWPRGHVSH